MVQAYQDLFGQVPSPLAEQPERVLQDVFRELGVFLHGQLELLPSQIVLAEVEPLLAEVQVAASVLGKHFGVKPVPA